jgi:hypothetical protein
MARSRRSRSRNERLGNGGWRAIIATILLIALIEGSWWLGLLDVGLFGWYETLFVKTNCGVETQAGTPCTLPVHGRLRGCRRFHSMIKVRTLLGMARVRASRLGIRTVTPRDPPPRARTVSHELPMPAPDNAPVTEKFQEVVGFWMGVVSTVATVLGTALAVVQFTHG